MSKVGNVFKMLILLKSRGKMKINDIARELEVSERQVRRYKNDLEQAGIYIKYTSGKYGGYEYDEKDYLLELNLTEEENSVLFMALEQLKYDNFIGYKDFELIVDKINFLKETENNKSVADVKYFVKNIKVNCNYEREKKIWIDINAAIITRNKIKIKYNSLNTGEKERIVRPYAVFQYKGSMYFVGYCELRQKIREFKISRIMSYEILSEKFERTYNFNFKEYMQDCFGIFKDEEIELKLEIKYPMSQIVKEKIWSDNQEIIDIEDKSIIFKAKLRGITEIKSWILSMGQSVEVIAPSSLKRNVENEIEEMIKIYKK
ncbi:WYL domain-containing transcriptional regulator [Clostridium sporogenes]|uniref:helix-turn-helix transcriptional regulator n=1 Tax=Clostridium sporogenes TaxID=1509 RepID=UPI0013D616E8|nr:WYL domain-containing transcriptional regulator [Clostridium sporogenes]MDU6334578.1 WYL domain-containing transcriptional regulator [Clostridium sporogenes]NFQ83961.1 WYL domain-containing transcriptional regulator [Clostridium sporogenes]